MSERFTFRTQIAAAPEAVAAWHHRPLALERLSPSFDQVERVGPPTKVQAGEKATLRTRVGPWRTTLVAEHCDVLRQSFVDEQLRGPFKSWRHAHRFLPDGSGGCVLEDDIHFTLPLAPASGLALPWIQNRLHRTFCYRHNVTAGDVVAHQDCVPKTIAITGASGFIGRALVPYLVTGGHRVLSLTRHGSGRRLPEGWVSEIPWDPSQAELDPRLNDVDVVIHLAGENVAGRWNSEKKKRILESRRHNTEQLARGCAALDRPPAVFISASGTGYYGDGGEALLEERTSSGHGFLSEVCRAWENATTPIQEAGSRTVLLRMGMVLGASGGALRQMVWPWTVGLGGVLGRGDQYLSWITLDDLLDVINRVMSDDTISGPINAVSAAPVLQQDLAFTLSRVLRRPSAMRVPAQVLRFLVGELADEGILCSQRVVPAVLSSRGHTFRHPRIEIALRHVLGR